MSHLTEEQLNLYLDNQLSPVERATIDAHLAGCHACRAELASLQSLFTALDSLQSEPLTIDLTPLVLGEVAVERQRIVRRQRIGWLVSGLQGLVVVLLLIFGWSALTMRYAELTRHVPAETLHTTWADTLTRGSILWAAGMARWQLWWTELTTGLLDSTTVLGQTTGYWPQLPGLELTTLQVVVVGLAAVLMWLVGNSILLRATAVQLTPNHHPNHQHRRFTR